MMAATTAAAAAAVNNFFFYKKDPIFSHTPNKKKNPIENIPLTNPLSHTFCGG